MARAATLNNDGLQILADLRRLREDARAVGEYSGTLDVSLEKQIQQQDKRAGITLRRRHVEHLNLQQKRRAKVAQEQTLRDFFEAWRLRSNALQSLHRLERLDVRCFRSLQLFLAWRSVHCWERSAASVSQLTSLVEDKICQIDQELAATERRLEQERHRMRKSSMRMMESHFSGALETQVFSEWKEHIAQVSAQKKKIARLCRDLTESKRKDFDREVFTAWRHEGAQFAIKKAERESKLKMRSMFSAEASRANAAAEKELVKMSWGGWRTECALSRERKQGKDQAARLEELCNREAQEQAQQREKAFKKAAELVFGTNAAVPLGDVVAAWHTVAALAARCSRGREQSERLNQHLAVVRDQQAVDEYTYLAWYKICPQKFANWDLRSVFDAWVVAYTFAVKTKRDATAEKIQGLEAERCAARDAAKLSAAQAASVAIARSLRTPIGASLRRAWQTWALPTATELGDAMRDLRAADGVARATSFKRKRLERIADDLLTGLLRERGLARSAVGDMAESVRLYVLRLALGYWRIEQVSQRGELRIMRQALEFRNEQLNLERDLEKRRKAKIKNWFDIMKGEGSLWVSTCFLSWQKDSETTRRERRVEKKRADLQANTLAHDQSVNEKVKADLKARKRQAGLIVLQEKDKQAKLGFEFAFMGWVTSFRERKQKAAALLRLVGMDKMLQLFDRMPAAAGTCFICWRGLASITRLVKQRQPVSEILAQETLEILHCGRAVSALMRSTTDNARESLKAISFAAWNRSHRNEYAERMAIESQQRWQRHEASAQEEIHMSAARRVRVKHTLDAGLSRSQGLSALGVAFCTWRRFLRLLRDEAELRLWEDPLNDMVSAQVRLEKAALYQHRERCLGLRQRQAHAQATTRLFSRWLLAARALRAARKRAQRSAKAIAIGEQLGTVRVGLRLRYAFLGWSGRVDRRRTKWLQNRVRQLRATVPPPRAQELGRAPLNAQLSGVQPSARSTTRVPWLESPPERQFHFKGVPLVAPPRPGTGAQRL